MFLVFQILAKRIPDLPRFLWGGGEVARDFGFARAQALRLRTAVARVDIGMPLRNVFGCSPPNHIGKVDGEFSLGTLSAQ